MASRVDLYCLLRGIAADVLCDQIVPDSLLTQSFEAVRPQSCIFARVGGTDVNAICLEDALGFISDISSLSDSSVQWIAIMKKDRHEVAQCQEAACARI